MTNSNVHAPSYVAKHELSSCCLSGTNLSLRPTSSSAKHEFGLVVPLRHANPLHSFAPLDFFSRTHGSGLQLIVDPARTLCCLLSVLFAHLPIEHRPCQMYFCKQVFFCQESGSAWRQPKSKGLTRLAVFRMVKNKARDDESTHVHGALLKRTAERIKCVSRAIF